MNRVYYQGSLPYALEQLLPVHAVPKSASQPCAALTLRLSVIESPTLSAVHSTTLQTQTEVAACSLRAAGFEIDLPQIVFVGKQSAGKSSIVEAVTGIQLPRNHGTCTRCPIEVTSVKTKREEEPWSCRIGSRVIFDEQGKRMDQPRITIDHTLSQVRSLSNARTRVRAQRASIGTKVNMCIVLLCGVCV